MNNSHGTRLSEGTVYYDWPSKQQRIDHTANSSQCHHWYGTYEPCTEHFTAAGEVYIFFPSNRTCCLESCTKGCRESTTYLPRPDYVNFTTFAGYETVDGWNCSRWNSSMLSWFTVEAEVPVLFSNGPEFGGPKVYALHYNVASFRKVTSDPSVFALPPECKAESKCER
jgi:hypothetical protein